MPTPPDAAVEALLERAAAGDEEAAGEVVCAYDGRLRRVIRVRLDRRLLRRVDADDVLQETHIEAVQRLPEYLAERKVPLLIWLRFLAVQRCITLARRHLIAAARDARREQRMDAPAAYDSASAALEHALSAHMTTPSGAAARTEMESGVRRGGPEPGALRSRGPLLAALRGVRQRGNSRRVGNRARHRQQALRPRDRAPACSHGRCPARRTLALAGDGSGRLDLVLSDRRV